jgi:hypothetical protein
MMEAERQALATLVDKQQETMNKLNQEKKFMEDSMQAEGKERS